MSSDKKQITKENLDYYLSELGKTFRKLNGTKTPAEIILIGGASALANYGFRDSTYDIDAIILASSAMKDAIHQVGDRLQLQSDWLNTDFMKTSSYSPKLREVSKYYRTFSNVLSVRTVNAEYLVAMKMRAARQYKHDLSDIVGIIGAQRELDKPLSLDAILAAYEKLYGDATINESVLDLIKQALLAENHTALYRECVDDEQENIEELKAFDAIYPETLKQESVAEILKSLKSRKQTNHTTAAHKRNDNFER